MKLKMKYKPKVIHKWKDSDIVPIEEPMEMSYREAYAWQLGWEKGWEAARSQEK